MKWFVFGCLLVGKIIRRMRMYAMMPMFSKHGKRFRFDPDGCYNGDIVVGDDVSVGYRPVMLASESRITIGNKVMFGPEVVVLGGNHNTSVVGAFMYDVHEKRPEDDIGVVIEDDVWVGSRAMILDGVTIGRGAIVGAGAIVTKSLPPYSISAGVPARVIKYRWDVETIMRHEEKLYPPEARLSKEQLEARG